MSQLREYAAGSRTGVRGDLRRHAGYARIEGQARALPEIDIAFVQGAPVITERMTAILRSVCAEKIMSVID